MKRKIIIVTAIIVALAATAGCALFIAPIAWGVLYGLEIRPRHVESLARNPTVQSALLQWVEVNVTDELTEGNGLTRYLGPRPGRYHIGRELDPVALGLGDDGWFANLICDRGGEDHERRVAVYFCDGGRQGIVVRLGGEWGVPVDEFSKVIPVADRVAFHSTTD